MQNFVFYKTWQLTVTKFKKKIYKSRFLESLQPLLEEQFDPKAFAAQTIQNQTVGEMLFKLVNGIAELDNELYTQVHE